MVRAPIQAGDVLLCPVPHEEGLCVCQVDAVSTERESCNGTYFFLNYRKTERKRFTEVLPHARWGVRLEGELRGLVFYRLNLLMDNIHELVKTATKEIIDSITYEHCFNSIFCT